MSTPLQKAAGIPVLIRADGEWSRLEKRSLAAGEYTEAWLQQLAFDHPDVLPIADIEPGFGELCSVAREVPCGHGYIDNLYVTAAGDIVLVEAKLWRNPQARREVVAQALDYVAALMGMDYEAFERACRKGQGMAAASLHALVAERGDALDEQSFFDAVSRNLRRGRMLVIALGDGIRSETEALADLLQSHAGAHFTFALVELAAWKNPLSDDIVVFPSTLARTAMITRGIVAIESGTAVVRPVVVTAATRSETISDELYFEALGTRWPQAPAAIRSLLARLEPLGVYPDLQSSLSLKLDLPGAPKSFNFGYITKGGKVWTDTFAWNAPADIALTYNEHLAAAIGGVVSFTKSGSSQVTTNGSSGFRITDILPAHEDAWVEAITQAIDALRAHAVAADA